MPLGWSPCLPLSHRLLSTDQRGPALQLKSSCVLFCSKLTKGFPSHWERKAITVALRPCVTCSPLPFKLLPVTAPLPVCSSTAALLIISPQIAPSPRGLSQPLWGGCDASAFLLQEFNKLLPMKYLARWCLIDSNNLLLPLYQSVMAV